MATPQPTETSPIQKCLNQFRNFTSDAEYAFRPCDPDGKWMSYTPCFTPLAQMLVNKLYDDEDPDQAQEKLDIAHNTQNLQIVGISTSLITLLISLLIFTCYRPLHNQRTCINICLFITMTIQMTIRLISYIDQVLTRNYTIEQYDDEYKSLKGLNNQSYMCVTYYIFLEYSISSALMWMFAKVLYLHSKVTAYTRRDRGYRVSNEKYYIIGWVLPVISTAIWAILSAIYYAHAESVNRCWAGYNYSGLFWILQAPRMVVVTVNLVFLLYIMRLVVVQQRRSRRPEMEKIGKAAKAALLQLPLLGIINFLNMIEPPLDGSVWEYRLWSYGTNTLRSFQGFFIAMIYCFTNAEVRQVIVQHYRSYRAVMGHRRREREECMREAAMTMGTLSEQYISTPRRPTFSMMRLRSAERPQNVSETEFGANISQENTGMTSRISEMATVSGSVHTVSEVSQTGRPVRYRHGTPRLNTRALVMHNIPTQSQTSTPKDHRDTKVRLEKLRIKSTPNISKIGLGAGSSHDERGSRPARYIPHHHGVHTTSHNIPLPYHTRPMPLKETRISKHPRKGMKDIRAAMSTSTPNISGIHYGASTSQDEQSFETIAASHLHNKRMPYK